MHEDEQRPAKPVPASRYCDECTRPRRVCVCDAMPHPPLVLHGRVLVLQHPHEEEKHLGTVKLLRKCLAECDVLVGRKFNERKAPLLDRALSDAAAGQCPLYLLYPGPSARLLDEIVQLPASSEAPAAPVAGAESAAVPPAYTLLLIDGTWPQAREMMNKLAPRVLPPSGPGVVVRLPDSGPSACLLRKEKREGNVMTMEAAAHALGVLERNPAVCAQLLAPLKRMTALQADWSPAIRSRIAPALQAQPSAGVQQAMAQQ